MLYALSLNYDKQEPESYATEGKIPLNKILITLDTLSALHLPHITTNNRTVPMFVTVNLFVTEKLGKLRIRGSRHERKVNKKFTRSWITGKKSVILCGDTGNWRKPLEAIKICPIKHIISGDRLFVTNLTNIEKRICRIWVYILFWVHQFPSYWGLHYSLNHVPR